MSLISMHCSVLCRASPSIQRRCPPVEVKSRACRASQAAGRAQLATLRPKNPLAASRNHSSAAGPRLLSLRTRCSSSSSSSANSDIDTIREATLFKAGTGEQVQLGSAWDGSGRCVFAFLTHFADLSSVEFAQKLLAVLPEMQAAGVTVVAVGLGEFDKAAKFCELTGFPADLMYADPSGSLYTSLGFSRGFAPDAPVSAYAKLLPMLAGIGSPGTMQEVFRGYLGDRSSKPVFPGSNPFDVLGTGYQRPMELATLRLYNMQQSLTNWSALCPADERLLTQQGGCIAFDGREEVFRHADAGILKYANVDELTRVVLQPREGEGEPVGALQSQVLRTFS